MIRALIYAVLILSTAAPALSPGSTGQSCSPILLAPTFYSFKPHDGHAVSTIEWENTALEISQIRAKAAYELGEGAEGTVYRIQPASNGPTYILKSFNPDEENGVLDTVRNLTYWHILSSKLGNDLSVRIVPPKAGPLSNTLIFEDVRGETDWNILNSKVYSQDLKARFAQKFLQAVADFAEAITQSHPEVAAMEPDEALEDFSLVFAPYLSSIPAVHGLEHTEMSELYIYFSPFNVLYDMENDKFVITDPV